MNRFDLDNCRKHPKYNAVRCCWFVEVVAPGGRLIKTTRTFPTKPEAIAAADAWVEARKGTVPK